MDENNEIRLFKIEVDLSLFELSQSYIIGNVLH